MQRMKGQGTPVPNGPKDQNYTNPMNTSMAAAAASDPYMSSFYMTSNPYQAFGVGDGTWSNGGEHMQTFLGGYGGQVGYDSHSTIDGIFSGGNFGGFNAPSFNYGFHGNGDYNAWGGSDVRSGTKPYDEYYQRNVYQDDRIKTLDQGVQGLTLAEPKVTIQDLPKNNGISITTNGTGGDKISGEINSSPSASDASMGASINQPKKGLSWANVASQPAKPQPSRRRDRPTMSSIVPGRHMDIGTWDGKNGGPKSVAPPPAPRPAWEAPRGGSRSTTSTSYSTPPPRTPPQTTPTQQPPSPQVQSPQQQQSQQVQQSSPTQQQNHQAVPLQGSPQPMQLQGNSQQHQQLSVNQQHQSPASPMLQGGSMREMSGGSPQDSSYGSSSLALVSQSHGSSSADLHDMEEVQNPHDYNPKEFDMSPKNARFFVIKSYSEDDIHRSIKYEIWCSTEHGNKRLDAAFREREGKGPIYLFYSVNGSGHFCGIAQMISQVDYNSTSNVWAQDKWKGQFRVKWIYVKDVPNNPLRHIRLENNENKPVTNSRDTQEVPYEKGKQVLKIIHTYRHTSSIFDDFIHYEKRQVESEFRKGHQGYKELERDDRRSESKEHHRVDQRGDQRGDPRGEQRGDSRGDQHGDHRGDQRGDPRGDQRGDQRGDPRGDQRGDPRGDQRGDPRGDQRGDPRGDQRGDPRGDQRGDPRVDQRGDPRVDQRGDPRGDHRGDFRDHRDHKGDYQRDYHRGGSGGGRGRGHHHHHHRGGGGGRQ